MMTIITQINSSDDNDNFSKAPTKQNSCKSMIEQSCWDLSSRNLQIAHTCNGALNATAGTRCLK